MAGENWTMWLNITNLALGIVTLAALGIVFFAVGWDLMARYWSRVRSRADVNNFDAEFRALLHDGPHSLSVPGLGLTMADGGERINESDRSKKSSQE